jgi:hypothetical protein
MVYDQNYFNCFTLYGLPHEILHVFNTFLYENEFQNPQKFPTDHQSFSRAIYFTLFEVSILFSAAIFVMLALSDILTTCADLPLLESLESSEIIIRKEVFAWCRVIEDTDQGLISIPARCIHFISTSFQGSSSNQSQYCAQWVQSKAKKKPKKKYVPKSPKRTFNGLVKNS